MNIHQTSASVTLLYFRAIPEDGAVFLEWETATEIDSAGFYITRNLSQTGNYKRIGSFIPSEGDSVVGAYYEYRDSSVENGVTYFYILESWDYDNTVDFSDPVSATPGISDQTATPTITSTSSQTPTPSLSPSPTLTSESGETPTITITPGETSTPGHTPTNTTAPNPTSTPYPTNTPTPPEIDTPTPLPTATSVEVLPVTPSATLLPLPTIIIVYPTAEWTALPSPSPTPTLTQEPQEDYLKTGFRALGIIGLVCVVGLLWVMLAIWIFLLLRRLSA